MTAVDVAPDVKTGRNRLAAAIVFGHGVKHVYSGGFQSLIMPEIKIGLGLSFGQFGSLGTARQLTWWLATMTAGYLGDRFSNRASLMLALSLSIMGVSYMLVGFATSYWAILPIMLLVGAGPSFFHPPAVSSLSRRFPERRGFAVSLHGMGGIGGEVLGPLVVAGLLSFMIWRDVLTLSVFPALLAAFVIWAVMRTLPRLDSADTSQRDYFALIAGLLRNRALLVLVAAVALRSIGEGAVDHFVPVYLRDELGYTPTRVAVLFSMAQVVALGAQPAMGYLSDRFGRNTVLLPGVTAVAVVTLALSVAEPGPLLAFLVVGRAAFKFSLHHIFVAAAIDAADGQVQSTVVSLTYGAGVLGIFSPSIAGLLSDNYGIQSAFVYGGVMMLLSVVALLFLRLPRRETAEVRG